MNEQNNYTPDTAPPTAPAAAPASDASPQAAAFGADLTKEEFCHFFAAANAAAQKNTRRISGVLSALMTLMCAYFVYDDWRYTGTLDAGMLTMGILVLVLGLFSLVGAPLLRRKRLERDYDRSLAAGQSYRGAVRVYDDRVEKETAAGVTVIPFGSETRFMEREDCLAFMMPGKPVLILPARYLTAEAAGWVKDRALRAIPAENQQLMSRITPLAAALDPPPVFGERAEETELMSFTVTYGGRELIAVSRESTFYLYRRRLPVFVGMAVLIGVLTGLAFESTVSGVGGFLGMVMLSYLLTVERAVLSQRRHLRVMPEYQMALRVRFTDRQVSIKSRDQAPIEIPWVLVRRAVQSKDAVRLYTTGGILVMPLKQIPDAGELARIVDRYMSGGNA